MSLKRLSALVCALLISACSSHAPAPSSSAAPAASGKINVLTTISTFNSFVSAVGGDRVDVSSLVPIGASPETYQPTPQDAARLAQAQLLVENGAGLETWLARTIKSIGSSNLKIVVGSAGLPVVGGNPHLWMDPQYAKHYVAAIRDGLIAIDPAHAEEYRANAVKYDTQLDMLTTRIAAKYAAIPKARRMMIVYHPAFQYYDARFGIQSLGVIEISPGQEPNPQQIAHLIDLAKAHDVHAIFSEPEYSPKLAHQIAGSANISIVDNLYDDSLGTKPEVADYISMLEYDTDIIARSMK